MYDVIIFPFNKKRYIDFIKQLKKICVIEKKDILFPCVKIKVLLKKGVPSTELVDELCKRFYDIVISIEGKGLVEEFANRVFKNNILISVAESCTGGLLSHLLTSIPGSSSYFLGGVVSYSNDVKKSLLNIPDLVLQRFGAVHLVTAYLMAKNVKQIFGSHLSISTTGIAGPGGGSEIKPVGTICIGICYKDFSFAYQICEDHNNRELNKIYFAYLAINYARITLLRGL